MTFLSTIPDWLCSAGEKVQVNRVYFTLTYKKDLGLQTECSTADKITQKKGGNSSRFTYVSPGSSENINLGAWCIRATITLLGSVRKAKTVIIVLVKRRVVIKIWTPCL